MRDRTWSNGVYMAEFDSAPALTRAMRVFAAKGYTLLETYSPVPMSYDLKRSRSRLPVMVFIAGLLGGVVSYAIQWYANVYAYPLDIGGRPTRQRPASTDRSSRARTLRSRIPDARDAAGVQ